MPKKTSYLPYFKTKQKPEEKILANFLLRKSRTRIKKKFPQHFSFGVGFEIKKSCRSVNRRLFGFLQK